MKLYLLVILFGVVHGEYNCYCNYNVEQTVYTTPSDSGVILGYLYEFDCKEVLQVPGTTNGWTAIAFQHQLGYVLQNDQGELQICPGVAPDADKVTTTTQSTSTTSTSTSVNTTPQPTTPQPTTPQPTTPQPTTTTEATTPTTFTTPKSTTARQLTTPSTAAFQPAPTTVPPITTTTTRPTTSTMKPTTTTSSTTTQSTTLTSTTTTTIPTTTSTTQSTTTQSLFTSTYETLSCPTNVVQSANIAGGQVFVDSGRRKCYEFVPTRHTWTYSENVCQNNGGHLATINSVSQNQMIYQYVRGYGQPTWIGLSDRQIEEHFEWSSGEPVTYINWHDGRKDFLFHSFENCVAMGPLTGTWEDLDCSSFNAYICEYGAVSSFGSTITTPLSTSNYSTDGNTNLCPPPVVQNARYYTNRILGQYGKACYELITNNKVSFMHGEDICSQHGGHLAYITSDKEQAFVEAFMMRHSPNHAVWIGLHDMKNEGTFEWTSGNSLTYTNWIPGHADNFYNHNDEDCVVFVPYKNGIWDDIPCGDSMFLIGDIGQTYPVLCQYLTHSSNVLIG